MHKGFHLHFIKETWIGLSHLWGFTFTLCYIFYSCGVLPLLYNSRMAQKSWKIQRHQMNFLYIFCNKKVEKMLGFCCYCLKSIYLYFKESSFLRQKLLIALQTFRQRYLMLSESVLHLSVLLYDNSVESFDSLFSILVEENISDSSYIFPALHLKLSISPRETCSF